MSIDVKTLLNKKFIKYIVFYHIIHYLNEPKNDLLASYGPLCRKFVMINENYRDDLPNSHPICDANIIKAKIYFHAVWDMRLTIGKGICHAISMKKNVIMQH